MSNITKQGGFSLTPTSLEEAMKFAEIMSKSTIVPKEYYNKPGDILVAVQMGAEIGLSPMQALQNIASINGKPSIYGDAALALVKSHPQFEDIREYIKDGVAYCEVKRKGQSLHVATFSEEDAKKAKLWGKPGPWQQYPERMLKMRARGFALRDTFPDALKGLITAEEARDYPVEHNITTVENMQANLKPTNKNDTKALLHNKLNNILSEEEEIESPEQIEAKFKESQNTDGINPPLQISIHEKLSILINQYNIPNAVISKWLTVAQVNNISELSEEQVEKCINWIDSKYNFIANFEE